MQLQICEEQFINDVTGVHGGHFIIAKFCEKEDETKFWVIRLQIKSAWPFYDTFLHVLIKIFEWAQMETSVYKKSTLEKNMAIFMNVSQWKLVKLAKILHVW